MEIDRDRDLVIERVIRAPRGRVWDAWTDPTLLAAWWVPPPAVARIDVLDPRPGGAIITRMSDDGDTFLAHTDGIFLVVEPVRRLVFTNAITASWHPATPAPVPMTAEIILGEHPEGTDYRAVVRHADAAARARHEELGFFEGWRAVTEALAALAEA
ncbi:polyketide cyclase [Microbacterium mangrovi]|uniref:Polyketide cyclase n=1 Tax=Microbacterium mangrovi TaxID=1348253 RepID=A0A0B2ABX2_9MICO|nr:SRPBCC domain-containing protein [Microbacterium mangrovi]KHK99131.1 polyketide cyclase [Microbacterium mangrovi]